MFYLTNRLDFSNIHSAVAEKAIINRFGQSIDHTFSGSALSTFICLTK